MTNNQESILTFPCEFPIKVFGKKEDAFETAVLAIVKNHVKDLKEDCLSTRDSKDGKYIALTITFTAESQAQLDAIYQDLSKNELVLLAL
ncbi:MAG: YbeD family protein [Gammaproteobacteria bacterium]